MDQDCRRLEIGHQAAQTLAFVRAVEEADQQGGVLPLPLRRQATVAAREESGGDWPARRAEALLPAVVERWPFVPRLLRLTNPGRGLAVPVTALALLLGLGTNALGPDRQIHVLALPLAGLIAWNVAVGLLMAVRRAWPVGGLAWRDHGGLVLGLVHRGCRRWAELLPADGTGEPDLVRKTLASYLRDWLRAATPLSAARIRRLLHLASLAILVGAVGGMYVRGLVFAYRATWESTFASDETVQGFLDVVLGPASAVTGLDIPEAGGIRTGGGLATGGDAGVWIHLWAVTAALFAGLPRAVLVATESLRVRRLARRLPVELPALYLERLTASASTAVHRIDLVPYSYQLPATLRDTLRARLQDVFGARSDVRASPPVEYGSEPDDDLGSPAGRAVVVVFNLAQTPEPEVHEAFLSQLVDRFESRDLLVVVDGSVFRERAPAGEEGESRTEDRRRAWDRVISAAGRDAVHVDLKRDAPEKVLGALLEGRTENGG